MAKPVPVSTYMNVSFRIDERSSNDTVKDVSMNWANRSPEEVRDNLNTWLQACGYDLVVVDKK